MDFGARGRIGFGALVSLSDDEGRDAQFLNIVSVLSHEDFLNDSVLHEEFTKKSQLPNVTRDFLSYYEDEPVLRYKTRIVFEGGHFVDLCVPIQAIHHMLLTIERYDFADNLQSCMDDPDERTEFFLDLTARGISDLEQDYQSKSGLFKAYDYYVDPLISVNMKSPATLLGIEALYPGFN